MIVLCGRWMPLNFLGGTVLNEIGSPVVWYTPAMVGAEISEIARKNSLAGRNINCWKMKTWL